MEQKLERFFEQLVPFLRGRTTIEELCRELGPSPSGARRVAFYQTLVRRDVASILNKLFPALARAAERTRAGLWKEIIRGYSRQSAPRHWDPNRYGEGLCEWLAARCAQDSTLPTYLAEIADFTYLEYAVGVAPEPDTPFDLGLDRRLFVREYAHDVPMFVRAIMRDSRAPEPRAIRTVVIVHRDREGSRARTYYPRLGALVAIARRRGLTVEVPGVDEQTVAAADRDLVRHGVLPPPER